MLLTIETYNKNIYLKNDAFNKLVMNKRSWRLISVKQAETGHHLLVSPSKCRRQALRAQRSQTVRKEKDVPT